MRVHRFVLVSCLAAVVALAGAGVAAAQGTTTGSIGGRIVDAQGLPVPGVAVTVTSAQGAKTFVTGSDGRYLAPFLTPGTYSIKALLQGFKPIEQKNIEVRLGQHYDINLTMQVGGLSETVQVSGAPPVIDTNDTLVATNLDASALTRLPVERRFTDALYIAPGVSSGGSVGQANPSMSGGSGLENTYIVDGVNITNEGFGGVGSYSIVFGSLGTGTPFDFVKEVQVDTAGFEAQNAASTGGLVNVITKSGTNSLRGSAFGYLRPSAFENTFNRVETVNGTVNTTGITHGDAGVEIGGPVVRDRVFFFGAFDPMDDRETAIAPDGFPLASLGPVTRERRIYNYAAKGTFQLSANHRIDASFFGDPARGLSGPQRGTALLNVSTDQYSSLKYGGNNETVRYNGILSSRFLLEASYAHSRNNVAETPSSNTWDMNNTTVVPNVRSGGIGFYDVKDLGTNNQFDAKATNIFDAAGAHQLKYGFLFQRIGYDNVIQYSGPTFTLPNGVQTATGAVITVLPDPVYGQIYRVIRANITNTHNTNQDYSAAFVQDDWKIGDKVTIQPGLRWERQKLIGNVDNFTFGNNWAPRVGAIYDPSGMGKFKIYGNFGLYYSVIPNDLAARSLSADNGVNRADYFDANLTQPVPAGVLAGGSTVHFLTSGLAPATIAPGTKTSKFDEEVAGFDWEAVPGWDFGVRYIHRNMDRVLEDTGNASLTLYFTRPDVVSSTEYMITNPTNGYPPTLLGIGSFEAPIHRYNAVQVTATRRFANNWGLQASYQWSRLFGDYEGFYRNDNGQSDPGISSLYDFPTNDPTYTQIGVPDFGFQGDIRYQGSLGAGPLPNDRTHQAKVYGNYQFRMGLNVGVGFEFSTGAPLTGMAANPVYENAGEIPVTPRGGGIQTIDGFKTRTPATYDTNVHADYRFKLGGHRDIVALVDVFNLFNEQRPLNYDYFTQTSFLVSNPDFGTTSFEHFSTLEVPRQVRVGVRFEF